MQWFIEYFTEGQISTASYWLVRAKIFKTQYSIGAINNNIEDLRYPLINTLGSSNTVGVETMVYFQYNHFITCTKSVCVSCNLASLVPYSTLYFLKFLTFGAFILLSDSVASYCK